MPYISNTVGYIVLRLPMRDGNLTGGKVTVAVASVLRLPMSDGNSIAENLGVDRTKVLRLPMRDGNLFHQAYQGC